MVSKTPRSVWDNKVRIPQQLLYLVLLGLDSKRQLYALHRQMQIQCCGQYFSFGIMEDALFSGGQVPHGTEIIFCLNYKEHPLRTQNWLEAVVSMVLSPTSDMELVLNQCSILIQISLDICELPNILVLPTCRWLAKSIVPYRPRSLKDRSEIGNGEKALGSGSGLGAQMTPQQTEPRSEKSSHQ